MEQPITSLRSAAVLTVTTRNSTIARVLVEFRCFSTHWEPFHTNFARSQSIERRGAQSEIPPFSITKTVLAFLVKYKLSLREKITS